MKAASRGGGLRGARTTRGWGGSAPLGGYVSQLLLCGVFSFEECFGVGGGLLPSFFLLQNSSLYQDFVEVVDCNEVEVSADPPCCESWEP